ncbi:MAG: cell division protein FtsH [Candidatus Omnitrophica bacterium CG07_land_8_20_14_0_80_50_8]|nr:MAG: cell division protein FtsH [Candidatus Omnitrophica bacterium CG07_land_8_20_14_0_80_50_8]
MSIFYFTRVGTLPVEKQSRQLTYGEFYSMLESNMSKPAIKSGIRVASDVTGDLVTGEKYHVLLPERDPDIERTLREKLPNYEIRPEKTFWSQLLYAVIGPLLFVGLFWFLMYRGGGAGGTGRIMSFGKSKARLSANTKITFQDVAGVEEAKEELKEIIEFLKEPKKFQKLGGKIPKGVLLMGPPGTGKTLLAKAVSGEADVPFFSISGSDFVEMFVGVGASRVRDLFEQAKKTVKATGKGCIIFIDEIDAIGRQRFAGIGGGHDEREQTLNALLVEMDGFNTQEAVILIAATNRPDVLDPALLRPGRFDRQIVIDRPDLNGREAILKVHTKNIKLLDHVDLKSIARQTPGFSGADIANLANEAALLAARYNKEGVGMVELQASIERVMAGPERKSRIISANERIIVAYHESGHTLLALLVPGADPLHKVSIIPRGTAALGYTMQVPLEDRYLVSKKELLGKLVVLLGGRASEELNFGEITTGAHNDLEVATNIARRMICEFGMSEKMGNLTLGRRDHQVFLGRDLGEERNYSEETARMIDVEIKRIIEEAYTKARNELTAHMDQLKALAKVLLEKEVLDAEAVRAIVGIPTAAL